MIELHKLEITESNKNDFQEYKFVFGSTNYRGTSKLTPQGWIYDYELAVTLKKTPQDKLRKLSWPLKIRLTTKNGASVHGKLDYPVRVTFTHEEQAEVTFVWRSTTLDLPLL